ncbi:unnamed protein product, partial [Closterium sp. NIES-54]
ASLNCRQGRNQDQSLRTPCWLSKTLIARHMQFARHRLSRGDSDHRFAIMD